MRVFIILTVLLFVLGGILFGAFNADMVVYDFGVARVGLPKGASILAALVLGWLLGGLVAWFGMGLSRRRHARERTRASKGKATGHR